MELELLEEEATGVGRLRGPRGRGVLRTRRGRPDSTGVGVPARGAVVVAPGTRSQEAGEDAGGDSAPGKPQPRLMDTLLKRSRWLA